MRWASLHRSRASVLPATLVCCLLAAACASSAVAQTTVPSPDAPPPRANDTPFTGPLDCNVPANRSTAQCRDAPPTSSNPPANDAGTQRPGQAPGSAAPTPGDRGPAQPAGPTAPDQGGQESIPGSDAPGTPPGQIMPDRRVTGDSDPTRALGTDSPTCGEKAALEGDTRQACELSGSIAHPYPVGHYGLDVQIGLSALHLWDTLMGVIQALGSMLWLFCVHVLNAMLVLLDWAFSLDLLSNNDVMSQLREGMATLHERVLGESWTLAAITAAGLWGLWWGLVRGKTIETITGLCASVGLMLVAFLIIYKPDVTVQPVSQMANIAAKQVFSGISQGTIDNPTQGLADAEKSIFDAVVLRPWCALQFADVHYCLGQRADNGLVRAVKPGELSIADVWLEHPPNSPERQALYRITAGKSRPDDEIVKPITQCPPPGNSWSGAFDAVSDTPGDVLTEEQIDKVVEWADRLGGRTTFLWGALDFTDDSYYDQVCAYLKANPQLLGNPGKGVAWFSPGKTVLQESSGTFSRMALLVLIVVGLLGAIPLFAYLAIRLTLAAVFTLLLLLMAPVMLLVAALGHSGRQSFVAWFQRLISQVVAKFVYALFLAVVVLEANIVSSLSG
jgi:hypothetical protein